MTKNKIPNEIPPKKDSDSGDRSTAGSSGDSSTAGSSGDRSTAGSSGDASVASAKGKNSIAVCCGLNCKARGALGNAIILQYKKEEGKVIPVMGIIGKKGLKENTFYKLNNKGKFVAI